jgi:hypothetical protein
MALWPKHPFIAKGVTSKGCKNALISPLMVPPLWIEVLFEDSWMMMKQLHLYCSKYGSINKKYNIIYISSFIYDHN